MPARRTTVGWTTGLIGAAAAALLAPLVSFGAVLLPLAALLAGASGRWLRPLVPAVTAIAAADLVGLAIMIVGGPGLLLSRGISTQLAVLLAVAVPWWLGRLRQVVVRQNLRERQLIDERARVSERGLIAADMHDALGHDLALIALRAGAWELDVGASATQRETAAAIRAQATSATDRLHQIVGLLREGISHDQVPASDLEALIEQARSAGLSIGPTRLGERRGSWSTPTAQAVHRVLQESLTNAVKHAPGSTVTVLIDDGGARLGLEVVNTGGRHPTAQARVGFGLTALDERVRQLGGTLSAERLRDGFAVRATIPVRSRRVVSSELSAISTVVRSQRRRSVRQSALLPAVLALVIVAALCAAQVVTVAQTALPPADYAKIRVGQPRSAVAEWLPPRRQPGPTPTLVVPTSPPGARCEFYLARSSVLDFGPDMFRICFDGRAVAEVVVSKDRLARQETG